MNKIVYAFYSASLNSDSLLLAKSIRKFAGKLSNNPIWAISSVDKEVLPEKMKKKFSELDVQIIPLKLEEKSNFPFVKFVAAASTASDIAMPREPGLSGSCSRTLLPNPVRSVGLGKTWALYASIIIRRYGF